MAGGLASLSVDGNKVAEGIGIGRDETRFTGKIHKIVIAVKDVEPQ